MDKENKFEEKLKRLDDIVNKMTNDALSLDESLLLYEEGNKIIKDLEEALNNAEEKIEKVIEGK